MPNTVDSNTTGLRVTVEDSFKVVNGDNVWNPLEPNSYGEFGGQISKIARTPISPTRQRKKGATTDVDASAGFNMDFTQENLRAHLPSFFYRNYLKSAERAVTLVDIDAANPDEYEMTVTAGFVVNTLVKGFGFTNAANRAVNKVTAVVSNTSVEVATGLLVAETPPAGNYLKAVGHEFASADINIVNTGGFPGLNSVSSFDFSTILRPGQWVYIGGDLTANRFAVALPQFARVRTVAVGRVDFDKTQFSMLDETGTGKLIRIFFGDMLTNPPTFADQVKTYSQLERSLGGNGYEYMVGCIGNTLNFNIAQASKVEVDIGFVCADVEQVIEGSRKAGVFPSIVEADPFNTTSDFSRLRLAKASAYQTDLFAYITDLTLTVSNGATPRKAVANLGAFDISLGDFVVGGSMTAYFSDIAAVQAVRNNDSVSMDFALVVNNAGWVFDIPLLTLGDGRLDVVKDQAITLPLTFDGAEHPDLDVSLIACYFPYLPTVAAG